MVTASVKPSTNLNRTLMPKRKLSKQTNRLLKIWRNQRARTNLQQLESELAVPMSGFGYFTSSRYGPANRSPAYFGLRPRDKLIAANQEAPGFVLPLSRVIHA